MQASSTSDASHGGRPPPSSHLEPASWSSHFTASRWTFTQGLIVGQISIVIVVLFLIRYVIFQDSATALEKERLMRLKISERRSKRHAAKSQRSAASLADKKAIKATFGLMLEKIGYDLSSHLAESTDWLNVMFAQAVAAYRQDVLAGGVAPPSSHLNNKNASHPAAPAMTLGGLFGSLSNSFAQPDVADIEPAKERTARDLMEEILNRQTQKTASFLDPIYVTEAHFGDSYPMFSNARIRPADDTGRMRIEVDVDYSDQITLAIDTKLLINFPKPRFAVLPISLSLTIVRFSGTLAVELFSSDPNATILPTTVPADKHVPPAPPQSRHQLHFSLHPDFALEASATSLLGSRAKLQDIPKIEQLLISRVRGWILDRFVWPSYWSLTLPNLVPSPSPDAAAPDADGRQQEEEEEEEEEIKLGTGVQDTTDDSIIEPGHFESARQRMQHQQANMKTCESKKPGGVGGLDSTATAGSAVGNVEAWRAQTAGAHLATAAASNAPGVVGLSSPSVSTPLAFHSQSMALAMDARRTVEDPRASLGLRSRSAFASP